MNKRDKERFQSIHTWSSELEEASWVRPSSNKSGCCAIHWSFNWASACVLMVAPRLAHHIGRVFLHQIWQMITYLISLSAEGKLTSSDDNWDKASAGIKFCSIVRQMEAFPCCLVCKKNASRYCFQPKAKKKKKKGRSHCHYNFFFLIMGSLGLSSQPAHSDPLYDLFRYSLL